MTTDAQLLSSGTTSGWKPLYKLGGAAALGMAAIILIQMAAFMTVPPPLEGGAAEWFAFFERNAFMGLIGFELLMVVYVIVSLPLTLALYIILRKRAASLMLLCLVLSVVGVVSFIAARPSLEMLSLSRAYSAAADPAQRAVLLAAGEATLATFHGLAFHVSYVLGSLTGLLVSLVMLREGTFSKATAWVRIGSSIFDFGLYLPVVGMYISIFSVFFLLAWDILVARRLFQLARTEVS
jgi:hypothetical protein